MTGCGADTTALDRLLAGLSRAVSLPAALESVGVADCVRLFVGRTFKVVEGGSLCAVASAFTFGREDLLPELFQKIVDGLNREAGCGLDDFRYYLHRQIGLDGDEQGPMAGRLIVSLCGSDDERWLAVEAASLSALGARLDFCDGVCARMRLRTVSSESAGGHGAAFGYSGAVPCPLNHPDGPLSRAAG